MRPRTLRCAARSALTPRQPSQTRGDVEDMCFTQKMSSQSLHRPEATTAQSGSAQIGTLVNPYPSPEERRRSTLLDAWYDSEEASLWG